MRRLMKETTLTTDDFICPIFVDEGAKTKIMIDSMPGIYRIPLGEVAAEVATVRDLGIPAVMLFGIPSEKNDAGSNAYSTNGIIQQATREIRKSDQDMVIMTDVCMCQYTSSGHCGIIKNGRVDNDSSRKALVDIAISQAEAGSNVMTPSAMVDGQVAAIRSALDDAGFVDVVIMSQSAKHRSNFYAPFRDAAECAPKFGDRRAYQVPFTNARESIREMETDAAEGVDIIMIKPALAYMDLIVEAKKRFNLPISAYNVSGEYALVMAAAQNGWIPKDDLAYEILSSIKRAGADMIATYFAKQVATFLNETGSKV